MDTQTHTQSGYFEIPRVGADISFEEFKEKYWDPEQPVIIQGVADNWPAKNWSNEELYQKLCDEPSATAAVYWYWVNRQALTDDFDMPDIVDKCIDSPNTFHRNKHVRIFIHDEENMTHWHYDANMVNVLNAQVSGAKEWYIVSPETPMPSTPFTNFALERDNDPSALQGKKYSHFILNAGEMLYLPPVWYHNVKSISDNTISLNWLFTKKQTNVEGEGIKRELERYLIQSSFAENRFAIIRYLTRQVYKIVPDYLIWRWRYDEMIETSYNITWWDLVKRVFKEIAGFATVIKKRKQFKEYTANLGKTKALQKTKQSA
jgi:hypothetical protein